MIDDVGTQNTQFDEDILDNSGDDLPYCVQNDIEMIKEARKIRRFLDSDESDDSDSNANEIDYEDDLSDNNNKIPPKAIEFEDFVVYDSDNPEEMIYKAKVDKEKMIEERYIEEEKSDEHDDDQDILMTGQISQSQQSQQLQQPQPNPQVPVEKQPGQDQSQQSQQNGPVPVDKQPERDELHQPQQHGPVPVDKQPGQDQSQQPDEKEDSKESSSPLDKYYSQHWWTMILTKEKDRIFNIYETSGEIDWTIFNVYSFSMRVPDPVDQQQKWQIALYKIMAIQEAVLTILHRAIDKNDINKRDIFIKSYKILESIANEMKCKLVTKARYKSERAFRQR